MRINKKVLGIHILVSFILFYLMSLISVETIEDVTLKGYVDYIRYEDGFYKNGDIELDYYPSYKNALEYGGTGEFLFAEDGLVYKDSSGLGVKQYIYDYSWGGDRNFSKDSMVDYIRDNKYMMALNILVMSNQFTSSVLLIIILFNLNKAFLPVILKLTVTTIGLFDSIKYVIMKDKDGVGRRRISDARLIRKAKAKIDSTERLDIVISIMVLWVTLMMRTNQIYSAVVLTMYLNLFVLYVFMNVTVIGEYLEIVNKGEK